MKITQITKSRPTLLTRIASILVAGMIIYAVILLAGDATLEQRTVTSRFWGFALAGFFAFIIPHLLFPDKRLDWIQMLNPGPATLMLHQARKLFPLLLILYMTYALLAFYDPGRWFVELAQKASLFAQGIIIVSAVASYAFYRFVIIGLLSQEWHEGKRGVRLLKSLEVTGQASAIPPGMIPSLTATSMIAATGMLLVVLTAYLTAFNVAALPYLPGLLLFAYAGLRLGKLRLVYDKYFYRGNAFYDELFRNPKAFNREEREPIAYDAVYWVPHRWRHAVWACLRQLDRRLPMGRIMLLFIVFLWFLFWIDVSFNLISAWLVIMITAKNVASYILTTPQFAPLPFQLTIQSPSSWVLTRFFVNVRWTPAIILSLGVVAVFRADLGVSLPLYWAAFDLIFSIMTAIIITRLHEYQFQKRYV
ncbi:MAG: hypothetical protein WEB89_12095 [Balneolales bacterium]